MCSWLYEGPWLLHTARACQRSRCSAPRQPCRARHAAGTGDSTLLTAESCCSLPPPTPDVVRRRPLVIFARKGLSAWARTDVLSELDVLLVAVPKVAGHTNALVSYNFGRPELLPSGSDNRVVILCWRVPLRQLPGRKSQIQVDMRGLLLLKRGPLRVGIACRAMERSAVAILINFCKHSAGRPLNCGHKGQTLAHLAFFIEEKCR